jgi:hypothetical protein
MIPTFENGADRLHKFLQIADDLYLTATTAPEKATFLQIIVLKLEGRAYEVVKSAGALTWEGLKADLRTKFLPCKTVSQIQIEIAQIAQRGSISDFAEKINLTLTSLNEAIAATSGAEQAAIFRPANERLALDSFIRNIRPELRAVVRAVAPTTLRAAIQAALEEEAILKTYNASNSGRTTTNPGNNQSRNLPQNRNPGIRSFREPNSQIREIPTCYNCGRQGHLSPNCRMPPHQNAQTFHPRRPVNFSGTQNTTPGGRPPNNSNQNNSNNYNRNSNSRNSEQIPNNASRQNFTFENTSETLQNPWPSEDEPPILDALNEPSFTHAEWTEIQRNSGNAMQATSQRTETRASHF